MGVTDTGILDASTIRAPGEIAYGLTAMESLKSFAQDRPIDSAFLITDRNLASTGVIDPVVDTLGRADVTVTVYDGVEGEPKLSTPRDAATALETGDHDLVVGVGGGSCMDTAKLASVLVEYDVSIHDMLGMGNVPGPGRPLALVSTTAGSGSEVTHIGVFTDPESEDVKRVIYANELFADLSVVDPTMTRTLPAQVAAATGLDALTHAIEAYTTLVRTPYTDLLARRAIELIGENLRPAVHQGEHNDRARANMQYAAMLAGQAFVNSGLGAVHALTYPIGIEYDIGHGEANAMLLPHVMAFNRPAEMARFADIAELLGTTASGSIADRSQAAVDAVFELTEDVGITPAIGRLGDIGEDELAGFAEVAFEYSSHNVHRNPRSMDREDAIKIYENAR